jgi:hypothetical protein
MLCEMRHAAAQRAPGPRLDLFARERRNGWTAYGDETAA